jgi:hypothetical protein
MVREDQLLRRNHEAPLHSARKLFVERVPETERMIGRQGDPVAVAMFVHHEEPALFQADPPGVDHFREDRILTDRADGQNQLRGAVLRIVRGDLSCDRFGEAPVQHVDVGTDHEPIACLFLHLSRRHLQQFANIFLSCHVGFQTLTVAILACCDDNESSIHAVAPASAE